MIELGATPTSDKLQIIPTKDGNMNAMTTKLVVIGVTLISVISIIALILAFVGVANKGVNQYNIYSGGNVSRQSSDRDDKIWTFHIGHYGLNTQYLDEESGTVRGYDVDVVNAVCQIANKNCLLIWDIFENCWDSKAGERSRGGFGLMSGWYDACIGWIHTRDRARTFRFTKAIQKINLPALFVKVGKSLPSNFNLTGLKLGFSDGAWIDEYCLTRYESITGIDVNDPNQIKHYPIGLKIIDGLVNGEIDVAFLPTVPIVVNNENIEAAFKLETNKCALDGNGLMTQKNQVEFVSWFNTAFDKLLGSSQYEDICNDLMLSHGHVPGRTPSETCLP